MSDRLAALECAMHRLAPTLLSEALLEAPLFTRLQVEAVLFDVLANSFALHLAAKTAKSFLKGLIVADSNENQGLTSVE